MDRADKISQHVAVLLSVAYPGVGQFIQRRWLAGAFYFTLFTAAMVWFIIAIVVPLFQIFQTAVEWASQIDAPFPAIHFSAASVLKPALISILIFVINIVDASYGHARRSKTPAQAGPPRLPKL